MIESLVLVRHAKAEARSESLEDHERQLTTAGIRSAKASLPRALSLIESPKTYRLWSSPAIRAWQTAEIVASAMGLHEIEQCPTLYSNEVAVLKHKLVAEEGRIVVVGHNPYLEELADSLEPCHLHFNKAAVVCYHFPNGSLESAELAWFVQGPDSSRWETLVLMEDGLQKAARKCSGAIWSFFDDPKSPEKLHEMRDALKREIALLDFAAPYLKKDKCRFMKDTLESFYRETGDLRKLSIPAQAASQWNTVAYVTPEAQRMYDRLRILEAERSRIISKLQSPSRQRDLHEVSQQLRAPKWKSEIEHEGIEKAELRRRFKKMKRALRQDQEALEMLPEEDRDAEAVRKLQKREDRLNCLAEGFDPLFRKEPEPEPLPKEEPLLVDVD